VIATDLPAPPLADAKDGQRGDTLSDRTGRSDGGVVDGADGALTHGRPPAHPRPLGDHRTVLRPRGPTGFQLVLLLAGAGFQPATFGLWGRHVTLRAAVKDNGRSPCPYASRNQPK
jgi:hypothetical protein